MAKFIEYEKFTDKIDAEEFILLLKENNIPYETDETEMKFRLVENPEADNVVVKIKESDISKVNLLYRIKENEEYENYKNHFLYTFSDEDIIDVVVNQSDWSSLEIRIANRIAKERDLKFTPDLVKSLRKDKNPDKQNNTANPNVPKPNTIIQVGAIWLKGIGGLSILNLILFIADQNLRFIVGLNINYVFIGIAEGIRDGINIDLTNISILLGFIISCLFIWFGHKSKKHNRNVYLISLIIYSLDTLLSVFFKDWITLGFHLFALFFIINGYRALISNKKDKAKEIYPRSIKDE